MSSKGKERKYIDRRKRGEMFRIVRGTERKKREGQGKKERKWKRKEEESLMNRKGRKESI